LYFQEIMRTKILVVDDDSDTTDLLQIILEPNAFEVIAANSGEEGIQLVQKNAPDVMIVDLLMPGMDGLKVLSEVRQFSKIPILVLSAVDRPNIAELALDNGADDFLIKPMTSGMLVASINKLTRRALAEQRAKITGGNGNRASEASTDTS
jgi:DNA-binding response OmpR family regulator